MKALITGVAGFVGGYLADCLNRNGWEVSATKLKNEKTAIENTEVYDLDILSQDGIEEILEKVKPDCIFHLVAQSSVKLSWEKPQLTADINIKGAINLLEAVRKKLPQTKVILIGSGEEYGRIESVPVDENTKPQPQNIYAVTKACQNMIGTLYSKAYNMNVVMVRAFNHIGKGQAPFFVVSDFCKQVADIEKGLKEPIINVGNLSAKRDFTDVKDVVRAYELIARYGKTGETYNVGSGKAIAIDEILRKIISMSEKDIEVRIDKSRLRPIDVPVIEADISKLRNDTGWNAEIPIERTIRETLDYWRSYNEKI